MHYVLQYVKADGRLVGVWQAAEDTSLLAQVAEETAAMAYAVTESDLAAPTLLATYDWVNGALTPKASLTLTATPNPFPADGVSECAITVVPFQSCTLRVNGQEQVLTPEDQTLLLTADSPQTFLLDLAPMGGFMAEGITVEAQ